MKSMAQERIVPPLGSGRWRRFVALGGAVGVPCGLAFAWSVPPLVKRLVAGGSPAWWTAAIVGLVVAALLPVLALLRVTQRWTVVMGFAIGCGLTFGVVPEGVDALARGDGGADVAGWLDGDVVWGVLVFPLLYAALAAAACALCRWLVVRTLEHDRGACSWCGYTRGSAKVSICPECGRSAEPARFRLHRYVMGVAWLGGHGYFIMLIALVALGACAANAVWTRTIPSARFYSRFPDAVRLGNTWVGSWASERMQRVPCVWIAEQAGDAGAARGLFVFHARWDGMAPMTIAIGARPESSYDLPSEGFPAVEIILSPQQARWVLNNGLPDGLKVAMFQKADEVYWLPAIPRGSVGRMVRLEPKAEWFKE
jgi:hypothetical protein